MLQHGLELLLELWGRFGPDVRLRSGAAELQQDLVASLGEGGQIIPSFQRDQEAVLAQLLGQGEQFSGEGGKSQGSNVHAAQGIGGRHIESGGDQDGIGLELPCSG